MTVPHSTDLKAFFWLIHLSAIQTEAPSNAVTPTGIIPITKIILLIIL